MEVMGGNGYVEDGPLARLYREFPVNSIWEGSGNVMCLDVLRAFGKSPEARARALARNWAWRPGSTPASTPGARACSSARRDCGGASDEFGARRLAEQLVVAVQAALLLRHAPAYVADAFVASRIAQRRGRRLRPAAGRRRCAAILARALEISLTKLTANADKPSRGWDNAGFSQHWPPLHRVRQ
jgi:putative acyl-CoA dehydrogenase